MQELIADPLMRVYLICAAILVMKMMFVTAVTGIGRIVLKNYITPEDNALMGIEATGAHPFIERMRRIHRNDLETVLPFLIIAFVWTLTAPSYTLGLWLFGLFTAARLAHTACYMAGWQPWRTIVFLVNEVIVWLIPILLLVALL